MYSIQRTSTHWSSKNIFQNDCFHVSCDKLSRFCHRTNPFTGQLLHLAVLGAAHVAKGVALTVPGNMPPGWPSYGLRVKW